jgi:hypothetical protein
MQEYQSYYIRRAGDGSTTQLIFFEGRCIGYISPSPAKDGYIVQPTWAKYKGFFKTFEKACYELISHYYSSERGLVLLEC